MVILPFSLFEILIYIFILSILIFLIYSIIYIIIRPRKILVYLKNSTLNIISIAGIIYFLFVILWGINYNRVDLEDSLITYECDRINDRFMEATKNLLVVPFEKDVRESLEVMYNTIHSSMLSESPFGTYNTFNIFTKLFADTLV